MDNTTADVQHCSLIIPASSKPSLWAGVAPSRQLGWCKRAPKFRPALVLGHRRSPVYALHVLYICAAQQQREGQVERVYQSACKDFQQLMPKCPRTAHNRTPHESTKQARAPTDRARTTPVLFTIMTRCGLRRSLYRLSIPHRSPQPTHPRRVPPSSFPKAPQSDTRKVRFFHRLWHRASSGSLWVLPKRHPGHPELWLRVLVVKASGLARAKSRSQAAAW